MPAPLHQPIPATTSPNCHRRSTTVFPSTPHRFLHMLPSTGLSTSAPSLRYRPPPRSSRSPHRCITPRVRVISPTATHSANRFCCDPTPRRILWVRMRSSFARELFVNKVKLDGSYGFTSPSFTKVPSALLAAEKEEARAVLMLFLKKQGLGSVVAARTIKKSVLFIDHLVSKLHSTHKSRYLLGRELTTLEIRDVLVPYLDSLLEEYGDGMVNVVEKFPDHSGKGGAVVKTMTSPGESRSKNPLREKKNRYNKERAIARVFNHGTIQHLPPHITYLMDLGLDIDRIKKMIERFPSFAFYSLEGKIKPFVEFLLELGVPSSNIPSILYKRPQLIGMSINESLKPRITFLENMGVDKTQWPKVIYRFPSLLVYSKQKVETTVNYLYELGLSDQQIGKVLTRCPHMVGRSVDAKLRPTEEYFRSLDIDVATLMYRCPQIFGLSVDSSLKPITEFFLDKGYTIEDIQTMVSRFASLYTFSIERNLSVKWEFFLTMDYPKSDLVKFPHFFGYNLNKRIQPRYNLVKKLGIQMILNQLLSTSEVKFERILDMKKETRT